MSSNQGSAEEEIQDDADIPADSETFSQANVTEKCFDLDDAVIAEQLQLNTGSQYENQLMQKESDGTEERTDSSLFDISHAKHIVYKKEDTFIYDKSEKTLDIKLSQSASTIKLNEDLEENVKHCLETSKSSDSCEETGKNSKEVGPLMFDFFSPMESADDSEKRSNIEKNNEQLNPSSKEIEEDESNNTETSIKKTGPLMFDFFFPMESTDDSEERSNIEGNLDGQSNPSSHKIEEEESNNTETSTKQTVECHIISSDQTITLVVGVFQTVLQVKELLSSQLKVSIEAINIMFQDTSLPNSFVLKDLNVSENDVISFTVAVGGYNQTSQPDELRPSHITVAVGKKDNCERKLVVVEVIHPSKPKRFLGGYRHKRTGLEYHHASAQTSSLPTPDVSKTKECRDSQTVFERHRPVQTFNTTSTQMTTMGCYVSKNFEKTIMAGNYVTADEYLDKRLKATITIQSFFRRMQAKKIFEQLQEDKEERIKWQSNEELKRQQKKEARIQKLLERIANPKTKQDFHLVYAMLEKWRLGEEATVKCGKWNSIPEQKAALYSNLLKEAEYISVIERKKYHASLKAKQQKRWKFLCEAALPKQWRSFDGRPTIVETPNTRHAARLKELYDAVVNSGYLKTDERLELLSFLKSTIQKNDCALVRDLVMLVEREVDLLMRGVSESRLDGLRTRINTLFFFYCKNPVFNPETYKLHKVNTIQSNDIYYCVTSQQYLSSADFYIKATSKSVSKCKRIKDVENVAYVRQDHLYYSLMLTDLRRKEENYKDDSKAIYLIQEGDLQHLVEVVWLGQSILSGSDDLFDLEMVRWNKLEEWSPWNCILLTHDESQTHLNLDHLDEAYSRTFTDKIKRKHMESRLHYNKVPGMAELLRKRAYPRSLAGVSMISGQSITNALTE